MSGRIHTCWPATHAGWPYANEPCQACLADPPLTRGDWIRIFAGAAVALVVIFGFLVLLFSFGPRPA